MKPLQLTCGSSSDIIGWLNETDVFQINYAGINQGHFTVNLIVWIDISGYWNSEDLIVMELNN